MRYPVTTESKSASLHLTEEQLKVIFKKHDINGDGVLSKDELKQAFAELGSRNPGFRDWRARVHADANRDGFIDEEELANVVKYAMKCGYKLK